MKKQKQEMPNVLELALVAGHEFTLTTRIADTGTDELVPLLFETTSSRLADRIVLTLINRRDIDDLSLLLLIDKTHIIINGKIYDLNECQSLKSILKNTSLNDVIEYLKNDSLCWDLRLMIAKTLSHRAYKKEVLMGLVKSEKIVGIRAFICKAYIEHPKTSFKEVFDVYCSVPKDFDRLLSKAVLAKDRISANNLFNRLENEDFPESLIPYYGQALAKTLIKLTNNSLLKLFNKATADENKSQLILELSNRDNLSAKKLMVLFSACNSSVKEMVFKTLKSVFSVGDLICLLNTESDSRIGRILITELLTRTDFDVSNAKLLLRFEKEMRDMIASWLYERREITYYKMAKAYASINQLFYCVRIEDRVDDVKSLIKIFGDRSLRVYFRDKRRDGDLRLVIQNIAGSTTDDLLSIYNNLQPLKDSTSSLNELLAAVAAELLKRIP